MTSRLLPQPPTVEHHHKWQWVTVNERIRCDLCGETRKAEPYQPRSYRSAWR